MQRGLAKRKEDRYATVGEMIEELHAVVEGTFPVTCPVTFMKRSMALVSRVIDTYPRTAGITFMLSTLLSLGAVVTRLFHVWT